MPVIRPIGAALCTRAILPGRRGESVDVPSRERGAGEVGAVEEGADRRGRVGLGARVLVHQQRQRARGPGLPPGGPRTQRLVGEALGDDGVEHPIDFEIISQYSSKDRIFYFGKNRALFNWDNLIMLVRNVGDEADNIAIMLDGLSAGIKFIQMQSILLSSIQVFKMANAQLNLKAVAVTENIEEEIRKAFDEIGSGSNLTEAEEDSIHVIVDKNRNMLDEILLSIRELEIEMEQPLSQYIARK